MHARPQYYSIGDYLHSTLDNIEVLSSPAGLGSWWVKMILFHALPNSHSLTVSQDNVWGPRAHHYHPLSTLTE